MRRLRRVEITVDCCSVPGSCFGDSFELRVTKNELHTPYGPMPYGVVNGSC